MKELEKNGFKELSMEELKEIQGGLKWWQIALGILIGCVAASLGSGGDMVFD